MKKTNNAHKVQLEVALQTKKSFLDEFDKIEEAIKTANSDVNKLAKEKFSVIDSSGTDDNVVKAKVIFSTGEIYRKDLNVIFYRC